MFQLLFLPLEDCVSLTQDYGFLKLAKTYKISELQSMPWVIYSHRGDTKEGKIPGNASRSQLNQGC